MLGSFFPPAIFEIKAVAGEAIATFNEINAELTVMEQKALKAGGALSTMEKSAGVSKAALLGLGVAAAGISFLAIKAASDVQVAFGQLSQALTNAGVNTEETRANTEKLVDGYDKLGFKATSTAAAFTKLVTATGDTAQATKLMGVAADYARFKHIALEDAATTMARATQGNARAFKELGITLDATLPKNQAIAKAFDQLNEKIGGQANAYTKTFKGQLEVLGAESESLAAKIGTVLIPVVTGFISAIKSSADFLSKHKEILVAFGVVLTAIIIPATILYTKKLYAQADAWMAANWQLVAVVVAIMAVVAAFVYAFNHFEAFRKALVWVLQGFIDIFRAVITGVASLFGALSHLPNALGGDKFKAAADATKGFVTQIDKAYDSVGKLSNAKITLPSLKGIGLTAGGAAAGGSTGIAGGLGAAGDTGGTTSTSNSSILSTVTSLTNRLTDVQKTYSDKMTSLQADFNDKSTKLNADANTKIKSAQEKFNNTMADLNKKKADDLAKIESDHTTRMADIQNSYADKLRSIVQASIDELRGAFTDATNMKDFFKTLSDNGTFTAEGVVMKFKDQLAKIKTLAADAAALAGKGFSQTFIQQVVAQGPDVGDQLAQSILTASPETVAQMQDLYGQIEATSNHGLDSLAASMNTGSKLATDELTAAYKATQTELASTLVMENQNFIAAQTDLNKTFNDSMAQAEKDRDAAIATAHTDLATALAAAQADLASAQSDAQKSLSDSLDKISRDFQDKLGSVKTTVASTIKAIEDLQTAIAGASVTVPATSSSPLPPLYAESLGISSLPTASLASKSSGDLTVNNNITVSGTNLADPQATLDTIANAYRFGAPQGISKTVSNYDRNF